jgi:histidine kinase
MKAIHAEPPSRASVDRWLQTQLFDSIPCSIAIIDPEFKIIENNKNFIELFGDGAGRHCYEVYKGQAEKCKFCAAEQTFRDGQVRVNDETGIGIDGQISYYIVHMIPIYNDNNEIEYVAELSIDITETKHLQKEYRMLFDQVPCYISVLNKDLRVVRANKSALKTFGNMTGKHCYEVYKHSHTKCEECPAEETFNDGQIHKAKQLGLSKDGVPTSFVVATSPLSTEDGKTNHVIEIALDITEKERLEKELRKAHIRLSALIRNSTDAVIIIDESGKITRCNPTASKIIGYEAEKLIGNTMPMQLLPDEFMDMKNTETEPLYLNETIVTNVSGDTIPVRFSGIILRSENTVYGRAACFQDLRKIKDLEKQTLTAERLAAVGQTVAGLAHSIRNILTGLEGGIYVVDSGLKKNHKERINLGWGMLHRNIDRISILVKGLLEFAGGHIPEVSLIDPADLTREVVDLFKKTASQAGIRMFLNTDEGIEPAPLDREDMHSCLANLITNALDACQDSDKEDPAITVSCYDKDNCLIFKVEDEGCGMACEVKKFIFTNFYTTKGTKGTGLGMLTVRKSVHEHGGEVVFESEEAKGSTFKIILPRENLLALTNQ